MTKKDWENRLDLYAVLNFLMGFVLSILFFYAFNSDYEMPSEKYKFVSYEESYCGRGETQYIVKYYKNGKIKTRTYTGSIGPIEDISTAHLSSSDYKYIIENHRKSEYVSLLGLFHSTSKTGSTVYDFKLSNN